jgi:acyl-CoA reductase-like NAD-dependent aldehyde dehydrogenase
MKISNPHSVETLARCFLSLEEIPPAFRVGRCREERLYLLDGQIRPWEGALAEVSSPICLRQADGTLRRPIIGQVPAMDEGAAMAGLNAAVRAWDNGRGSWPTMSVAARIAAVETFAAEMLELYTKEQFGPVVPVCANQDEQEFLNYVTQSNYGQQVSLFGRDPDKFVKLIDPLANQVCRINLNAQCQRGPDTLPFTGRKDSAEATLSISDALRCFSIRSLVAAQSNPESRDIIQEIVTRRRSNFLRTDFIL